MACFLNAKHQKQTMMMMMVFIDDDVGCLLFLHQKLAKVSVEIINYCLVAKQVQSSMKRHIMIKITCYTSNKLKYLLENPKGENPKHKKI